MTALALGVKSVRKRIGDGLIQRPRERMHSDQDGRCAICGCVENNGRDFCVDHDHLTGKVRALLCDECNKGIGSLRDSATLLRQAAEYIECHAYSRS